MSYYVTYDDVYDVTDHPERTLVLKAFYVNDTAVKAELYRDHVSDVITDALMAVRLNTSTLLHSRLHWRSASLSDLQVSLGSTMWMDTTFRRTSVEWDGLELIISRRLIILQLPIDCFLRGWEWGRGEYLIQK